MFWNCDTGENSWESLGLQGDQTSQFSRKSVLNIFRRTDAEAETPIFWSLMWRTDSFEKTLMLGKIEGRRRRGWQRMRWLDGVTDSLDMNLGKLRKMMRDRETWCATVHGVSKSWPGLGNWTTITIVICSMMASTFRVVISDFQTFSNYMIRKCIENF